MNVENFRQVLVCESGLVGETYKCQLVSAVADGEKEELYVRDKRS